VDTLGSRLANAGGSDERQRQRVLQFTQNIRQAEDATIDLSLQVEALGEIPEDEAEEAATTKREWRKERDNKNAIAAEFDSIKCEVERQVNSVESDITGVIQKRERLNQRQTRLNEQNDRLITANNEGFSAKQRKQQERLVVMQDRMNIENQYRSNINSYERRTAENNISTNQYMQTIQHYEALLLQQSQQSLSVPTTPEGHISPHANAFTSVTFPMLAGQVNSTPGSLRGGRGRSSSMLSNVSGFTDSFEEFASPSYHPLISNQFAVQGLNNGRKGSNGSGSLSSGTSSQSSSQRDPMSPVQNVKPMIARSSTGGSHGLASPINGW
jgi:hypothetical protein